ncbi:hypothetical protein [Novipirellula herctigrandis]|uniref:hypothetical protein n=1 Tax=Novipirellula herctigrandis TaxID=2527986 RepID=UPI003AF3A7EA
MDILFLPISFADQLSRERYWWDNDLVRLMDEDIGRGRHLPTLARIGELGGFADWGEGPAHVRLTGCDLTDGDLWIFEHSPIVGYLDLRDTAVSDKGLQRLTTCQDLWFVDLTGTRVTQQGVNALKTAIPDVTVVT